LSESNIFFLAAVLPLTGLVGGVLIILFAMRQRSQTLEMKHRERMAMIERGLVPGPARDPAAFENWQQRHERPPTRSTSIGVVLIALGFAIMLLVAFAGEAVGQAVGVGGAVVVIGAAFVVNGELQRRTPESRSYPPAPPVYPPAPPRFGSDSQGPLGP
jgi:hypothetical protein